MTTTIYEPTPDWPTSAWQFIARRPVILLFFFALGFAATCNGC